MESADEVRARLGIAALADLRDHEATSTDGEARVRRLLREAGVLSWPLVVDAGSGLILDGSHRAQVLRRDLGARFAPVQWAALEDAAVRVAAWCRVLEGVTAGSFDRVRRALGLEAGASDGLACHYGGLCYGRPGLAPVEAHDLAGEIERQLASNGHGPRPRYVEEEETAGWLRARDTVVVRLPALDKATIRRVAASGIFPAKSTRFLPPYRVVGLAMPLATLGGSRPALEAALERQRREPLWCLGAGLVVDRRYPERLWQFAGYRIPVTLFADEAGRRAYRAALARVAAAVSPHA
jgi:hypothetical protein